MAVPALQTMMSRRPKRSTAASTMARTAAWSPPSPVPAGPLSIADDPTRVLADAWHRYAAAAASRVEVLEEAAAALTNGGLDEELREHAAAEAHRLAGSLGMFGVPVGSDLALECEQTLR